MSDSPTGTALPAPAVGAAVVALGAAAGALLRWGIELGAGGWALWAVLAINVLGAFALGALPALPSVRRSPVLAAFAGPGFLGGFTTVSSWSGHTLRLLDEGQYATAGAYVLLTVVAAIAAAALGRRLARAALTPSGPEHVS